MLTSVLRLSGLVQRLAAFKLTLEKKPDDAVDHVKVVVVRMAVAAALAVAAAFFTLLALITGLVDFTRGWNPPTGHFLRSVSLAVFWL